MKYTPRELTGNVNVSRRSPLPDFAALAAGACAALFAAYLLLGLLTDLLARVMPAGVENRIGTSIMARLATAGSLNTDARVTRIFDSLAANLRDGSTGLSVGVVESPEVNAIALAGGTVLVNRGLLDAVSSDAELAFVLAHELGHYHNRDHLRAMGRSLLLITLSTILFGGDRPLNRMTGAAIASSQVRYSQGREMAADAFAVELVHRTFGTTEGAVTFFNRFKDKGAVSRFAYLFATHPSPQKRIEAIVRKARSLGWVEGVPAEDQHAGAQGPPRPAADEATRK